MNNKFKKVNKTHLFSTITHNITITLSFLFMIKPGVSPSCVRMLYSTYLVLKCNNHIQEVILGCFGYHKDLWHPWRNFKCGSWIFLVREHPMQWLHWHQNKQLNLWAPLVVPTFLHNEESSCCPHWLKLKPTCRKVKHKKLHCMNKSVGREQTNQLAMTIFFVVVMIRPYKTSFLCQKLAQETLMLASYPLKITVSWWIMCHQWKWFSRKQQVC